MKLICTICGIKPISLCRSFVLFYLLFSGLTSCDGQQVREEKYPNGSLKLQYSVVETANGSFLKEGKYKEWFPDGQQAVIGLYSKGKKSGKWESWYPNGQKQNDFNYLNDSINGAVISYHPNGKKEVEGSYAQGKRNGTHSRWNVDGILIAKRNYKNGEYHGLQETWFENGSKEREENYDNGKREGICKQWDRNGSLVMNALFEEGSLAGLPAIFKTQNGSVLEFLSPTDYKARIPSNRDNYTRTEWKEISGKYHFITWGIDKKPGIRFGDVYLNELPIDKITNDTIKGYNFLFVRQSNAK